MRFRAKFGLQGWLSVAMLCFLIVLKISELKSGHHNAALSPLVLMWIVFGLGRVLSQIFIYWDVDSTGVRERRLWSERTIPWQEVTRVSGWMDRPSSDALVLHYARPAPLSDSGTVVAAPDDRQQFLSDLHRFAPQATFDVSAR
jgi:hypothetical protein